MNERFKQDVIKDVVEYAARYKCSISDSITDWEGNGPEGQFGLQRDEEKEIRAHFFVEVDEFHKAVADIANPIPTTPWLPDAEENKQQLEAWAQDIDDNEQYIDECCREEV